MKILPGIFSVMLVFPLGAQNDDQAIRELIREAYIDGVYNEGIINNVKLGFSEAYKSTDALEDGTLVSINLSSLLDTIRQKKSQNAYPPTGSQKASVEYRRIDIEGPIASVKLEFKIGNEIRSMEFITVYKFEKEWKIVSRDAYILPEAEKK